MKFLSNIIADLRQGENLDLYLTVIAAIGLAALNVLGIAPANLMSPVTLAVLGLLAISSLRNRHQIDSVIDKISHSSKGQFIKEFPPDYKKDFESSRNITIIGTSLHGILANYYAILESKARRGDRIRFLLVHPDGAALEMAVSRALWETDISKLKGKIMNSLEAICRMKEITPNNIEVRTIKNPLSYQATLINHGLSSSKGVAYVEMYSYKLPKPFIPKHIFYECDGEWYHFIVSEIDRLWENGIEWPQSN